jgi:hypothetical protein
MELAGAFAPASSLEAIFALLTGGTSSFSVL